MFGFFKTFYPVLMTCNLFELQTIKWSEQIPMSIDRGQICNAIDQMTMNALSAMGQGIRTLGAMVFSACTGEGPRRGPARGTRV